MSEFLTLLPPPDARQMLMDALTARPQPETIATTAAAGRYVQTAISAPFPLPTFARSTVDGYAVRAADTYGASEGLPAYLKLAGEVAMGQAASMDLAPGTCVIIHTGGMLPAGADAVVMVEYTQPTLADEIEIGRAVGAGENVLQIGEDVAAGDVVIKAGSRLGPAEIGGLMALGLTEVVVSRQPTVAILSSGDEVVTPGQALAPGQVYDVNTYSLSALIEAAGAAALTYPIIPDEASAFAAAARRALAEADLVVFTAGSSVSVRDLTATTIAGLGQPGVLVHGVNVRPGKPTILAVCAGKAVIGLPGNPVSALVIARLFVLPVIRALLGAPAGMRQPAVAATLSINLASSAGREDWVPVKLVPGPAGLGAEPVFGKSNLIFTLARADGLLRIPADANGLAAGTAVTVELF